MNQTIRQYLRRSFVVAWLALAIAGALSHTIWPNLISPQSSLIQWLPHLKYGYVMFNKMPRQLPVMTYTRDEPGFGPARPIAAMIQTPAPGYDVARTALNMLFAPDFLPHLCKTNPKADGATFNMEFFQIGPPAKKIRTMRHLCRDGALNERR